MSNGKKGMPIWAWFGIGCGVIALIVIVVLVVGGMFVANKVKGVAEDFEKNPELAAARMVVKFNPEIEEVAVDEEAGTMTVRETSTGKQFTVSLADLKEGKFSITGEDGETVFSAEGGADGEGGVKITTSEGDMTISGTSEAGAESKAPAWVPQLDDQVIVGQQTMTVGGNAHGTMQITSGKSTEEIIAFYTDALQGAGFTANTQSYSSNDDQTELVQFKNADEGRTMILTIATQNGERTVSVTYTEGS
jgi:uncharacterized protein YneF (UPF0154 family)